MVAVDRVVAYQHNPDWPSGKTAIVLYNERDEIWVREAPEMLAFEPLEAFRLAIGLLAALATVPPEDLRVIYGRDENVTPSFGPKAYSEGTRRQMLRVLDSLVKKRGFAEFKQHLMVADDD